MKLNRIFFTLFFIFLTLAGMSIFFKVSSIYLIYLFSILAVLRGVFFKRYLNIGYVSSCIILFGFLIYAIFHSSNYNSDLLLTKYYLAFSILNLINILNAAYQLLVVKARYIVVIAMYFVISVLMTIEYIPYICYTLEILSFIIFMVIYMFSRNEEKDDKR